jgi:hypothetical protein
VELRDSPTAPLVPPVASKRVGASLAYAFLLSLCAVTCQPLMQAILRYGCHHTGTRSRTGPTPLCRLRSAHSRLWLAYPLQLSTIPYESSG